MSTPKPRRTAQREKLLADGRQALKLSQRMQIEDILLVVDGSRPRLYRAMAYAHMVDSGYTDPRPRKSRVNGVRRRSDPADSNYRADDDYQGETAEDLERASILS